MWMMFVTAIPCLGVVMIIVWALTGENESRKNYYRAMLAWFAIIVGVVLILALLGQAPQFQKHLNQLIHRT